MANSNRRQLGLARSGMATAGFVTGIIGTSFWGFVILVAAAA